MRQFKKLTGYVLLQSETEDIRLKDIGIAKAIAGLYTR